MSPVEERTLDAIEHYAEQLLNPANPMATATGMQVIGHEILTRVKFLRARRAAVAGTRGDVSLAAQIRDRLANSNPSSLLAEIAELVAPREGQSDKCEHGVLWSMECLSCGHSDYAAAPPERTRVEGEQEDTMEDYELDRNLKYTCPKCGGLWKAVEDAEQCHGMKPCTKETNCAALSHFGDCKSMPTATSASDSARRAAEEIRNYVDSLICAPPMREFERAEIERIIFKHFAAAPADNDAESPVQPEQIVVIDGERRRVVSCPDARKDCEVLHTEPATTTKGDR